ncbi:hypothetical protein LINGRAHAP2_LOCUS26644 [Linum grandiflorum]
MITQRAMDEQASRVTVREEDDRPPINLLKELLPLGSRPTDFELGELLKRKVDSGDTCVFDFYSYDPEDWHLAPARENIHHHDDGNTYIFAPYGARCDGGAVIRETPGGHWMPGGRRPSLIKGSQGEKFASKGIVNFYANKPDGYDDAHYKGGGRKVPERIRMQPDVQTLWQMHEVRLIPSTDDDEISSRIALCVAFKTRPPKVTKKAKKTGHGEDDGASSSTDSWADSDWDTDEEET